MSAEYRPAANPELPHHPESHVTRKPFLLAQLPSIGLEIRNNTDSQLFARVAQFSPLQQCATWRALIRVAHLWTESITSVHDLAVQSQALFNIKNSNKEERDRIVVRRFKFEEPRLEQIQDLEDMIAAGETVSTYSLEMDRIKTILVGGMAKNLGIDEGKFTNMFNNGTQSMRMNYYPPCPEASKVLGISPHSDATGLTVLLQFNQVHGLQINHNGTWVSVKMLPNALLVNIGDIIEILTNGKYKSIEHRVVVSKEKARLSVATFHETHESVVIGPLPELIINGETEQYKHVTFVEFFTMFLSRKLDGKSLMDDLKLKH
ncbi:hypothetical protein Syun_013161 [Stephania yunnanensis]|uniref:Fe2OG dioxygenase domain-containing protein n=1 Tax=Stephania yunnanensis TaxID=152371 RepID=A0AAP0K0V2_9MAGN